MSGVRRRTCLQKAAKEKNPNGDADGVDGHVEGGRVAALDEVLVDLIGDGVGDPAAKAGSSRPSARRSSAPRIAYSVMCAAFRSTVSHPPSPVPRLGSTTARR